MQALKEVMQHQTSPTSFAKGAADHTVVVDKTWSSIATERQLIIVHAHVPRSRTIEAPVYATPESTRTQTKNPLAAVLNTVFSPHTISS
jgi:hypothetical protein